MKPLTLGYSSCPNDTFIFYAMIHERIDTRGLSFNETLLDVETLNQKALNSELDITKVSYAAYGYLRNNYALLHSGGALGRGCGPLLVAKEDFSMDDLRVKKIAIPGIMTTAFLLLQLYYTDRCSQQSAVSGQPLNVKIMPFHEVMTSVQKGEADAGLIIHESRFTFRSFGLRQIADLGEWWEKLTGLPIPLGGIAAKRAIGEGLHKKINKILRASVEYAFNNRDEPMGYIKEHSQELSDEVINRHINLYVNDLSIDVGQEGEKAVTELLSRAEDAGIIPKAKQKIFV